MVTAARNKNHQEKGGGSCWQAPLFFLLLGVLLGLILGGLCGKILVVGYT